MRNVVKSLVENIWSWVEKCQLYTGVYINGIQCQFMHIPQPLYKLDKGMTILVESECLHVQKPDVDEYLNNILKTAQEKFHAEQYSDW